MMKKKKANEPERLCRKLKGGFVSVLPDGGCFMDEGDDTYMCIGAEHDGHKPIFRIQGIDLPDIPLWAIWAIQQYAKSIGTDAAREHYTTFVGEILDYILDNGHPNLRVNPANGMVETIGTSSPVSWMNSTLDGRPVIPRSGYLVEFNALWYNALMFGAALTEGNPDFDGRRDRWVETAE